MTQKLLIFFIIILIGIYSCTRSSELDHEKKTINKELPATEQDSVNTEVGNLRKLPPPIIITDLDEIRTLDWNSGVINPDTNYCYSIEGGHYGCYYLIDRFHASNTRDPSNVLVGEIVIHRMRTDKMWTVNDTTQRFQNITLRSNIIPVWDSIDVGTKKEKLLSFIGKDFHYQKGTILHAEFDGYYGDFTIIDDTIQKIFVSKKCD